MRVFEDMPVHAPDGSFSCGDPYCFECWPMGRWERVVDALRTPGQWFMHRVVHNGPLWLLCAECWLLRREGKR